MEWTLGLVIPLLVAGGLCKSLSGILHSRNVTNLYQDYVVQILRFQVDEGFGCTNSVDTSILTILLINSWSVIIPLLSLVIYYRASVFFQLPSSVFSDSHSFWLGWLGYTIVNFETCDAFVPMAQRPT